MQFSPLISIAIPAYKSTFLNECIESVMAQTYPNFELIIVNDDSPYDLDSIIECYSDPRIKYYKNSKNFGAINVVDNWNKCLEYVKGDYVICMGDDDKLLPNCLEEYCKQIPQYPNIDIFHARTEFIDEHSEFCGIQEARPIYESVYSFIWHRWNGRRQFIGDFLFKTKTLIKNGGFYKLPLAWGSDDVSTVIAAKERGIVNIQEIIFQYRINRSTISSSGNGMIKVEAAIKEKKWFIEFLNSPCNNVLDEKYRCLSQKMLSSYFQRKIIPYISSDIKSKGLIIGGIKWLCQRRKYEVEFETYIHALLKAIKF